MPPPSESGLPELTARPPAAARWGGPVDVAVIVVNWNSGAMLDRCLRALAAQTVRPSRVIVVDNGSSDGSADRLEARFPGVEVLRLGENVGFAAANNRAAAAARGIRWLALLNPDAFPEPGWLAALLEAADAHAGYSFFASRMVRADDPARLDGAGDVYYVNGLAARRGHGRPTPAREEPHEVFAACAAAALYRADEFDAVSGFDERFFCYFEDVDLAFRLRLRGARCLYVPRAAVHHVGSGTTGARSDFTVYHGHRNLVWTFFKDMPGPLLVFYLPQHLLLNAVTLAVFAGRGQLRTIVRAKWDALRRLPAIWSDRRRVQRTRTVSARAVRRAMAGGLLRPYRDGLGRPRR
ncbi:MAG TPA: glycosyltransferase family 2 protein [Vicinamibacteria bacterium]|nr:glycosyltransferase family 2 protein [Vicinamibacteria bacterium]